MRCNDGPFFVRPGTGASEDASAPRGACARSRRIRSGQVGAAVLRSAREWFHSGRAHQLRGGDRPVGDLDQLLRATRGRFRLGSDRRKTRNLRGADGSRGNHAPWRGCRLRLLVHPSARRAGARHTEQRQRPRVLDARKGGVRGVRLLEDQDVWQHLQALRDRVEADRLLEHLAGTEQRVLAELRAEQLQPDREPVG